MHEDPKQRSEPHLGPHGAHESRDVRLKPIVISGIAFFALAFLTAALLRPVYRWLLEETKARPRVTTPAPEVRAPHVEPRAELAAASGAQLVEVRGEAAGLLSSYGWVDREKGVVRVPIARAIELVAERGLPVRENALPPRPRAGEVPGGETNGFNPGGAP